MALLLYSGRFYCGATLINDRYVLTAAHCVNGFSPDRISVRLIEHDRSTDQELPSITKKVRCPMEQNICIYISHYYFRFFFHIYKIHRIVRHAGYSSTNYNNDIALLQLASPVKYSNLLRPACLPTPGKSFTGAQVGILRYIYIAMMYTSIYNVWTQFQGTVTGWGAVQEHGSISTNLQEVSVPIMSNKDCRNTAYGATRITDNMLCAGISEGGRDSCQVIVSFGLVIAKLSFIFNSIYVCVCIFCSG